MTHLLASLPNRIFLAATLLAWFSIAAALLFVNARLVRESEQSLDRRLLETATLVQQQRLALLDTVTRMALLVADLPKLKAALATDDAPTVAPIAMQYARDLNADLLVVTGRDGRVLATAGDAADGYDAARLADTDSAHPHTRLARHARGMLQIVTVPVAIGFAPPEHLGHLSVGFLLDDAHADDLKRVTGVDLAFAVERPTRHEAEVPAQAPGRGAVSAAGGAPVLASTLAEVAPREWPAALHAPASGRLHLGAAEFAWRSQPFDDTGQASHADFGTPVVIVLEPTAAAAATQHAVRLALAGIALATAALAVVVGYGVARTVTRPLATITGTMRDMARTGDLTRRLVVQDRSIWSDEDTRLLATTFNALTESIATFQQQARERERLSALGRLSTVIAHEIRNPLMIVRGALRQITRPGATSRDVQDAAQDIEEEVQRLNRVVDDVLDFAGPLPLALAPTDINAVATEAAGAARAARPHVPITLQLAGDLPQIACDADRLRTVLVNVLTNAQQAACDGGSSGPTVSLATARRADHGTLQVAVCDNGPGIADEDLPHVFEPYFTTRRTGTGLGLAIARTIVQGLGGSIDIATAGSGGTTVTIALPERLRT